MDIKQLFLLTGFIILSLQTPSPFYASNPSIQAGQKSLVLSIGDYGTYKTIINTPTMFYVEYETSFEPSFENVPRVLLGILSSQFDSTNFSVGGYRIEMTTISQTKERFLIRLAFFIGKTSWLKYLEIMFISVDLSKNQEFVVFQQKTIQVFLVNQSSYSFYHLFSPQPLNTSTVNFISAITGYQFWSTPEITILVGFSIVNSTSFIYTLTNTGTNSITNIISFIIIAIDRSIALVRYKYYQIQTVPILNNEMSLFNYKNAKKNQFFIGFYQFIFSTYADCGFKVSIGQSISIVKNPVFDRLQMNILTILVLKCHVGYYYYPRNNTCVETCLAGIVQERYCVTCIDYCSNCLNNSTCNTCIATRIVNYDGTTCICAPGYQQVGLEKCFNCQLITFGCKSCDPTLKTCSTCDDILYFQRTPNTDGQCVCQPQKQLNKDNSSCVCKNHFYDNNGVCQTCYASCKQCNGLSSNCTQCDQTIFRVQNGSQCLCKSSEFKQLCTATDSICNASVCYFKSPIDLSMNILGIEKNPNKNSLTFIISLLPALNVFNEIDLTKFLSFGFSISSFESFKYQNGLITTEVSYNEDIHRKNTQLTLNLSQHDSLSFQKTEPVSISYLVFPSNNLSANYYHPYDYWIAKYLSYFIYSLLAFTLAVFCVGIHSSKMAVSQMVGLIQIAYLGLFMLDQNSPLMVPMAKLRYGFGYNDILAASYGKLPIKIQQRGYSQLVLANLNLSLLLLIIPIILSFIFFLLSIIRRKNKNGNLSLSKLFIGECMMVAILFILYNLSASTIIFAINSTTRNWKFILSIVEIALSFSIVFIICLMYVLSDYNYFGEFKYMFKWQKFQLNYYLLQIAIRIISGVVLGAGHNHFSSGIVVMCLFIILSLITAIKNPFADKLHTIRSAIITFVGAFIIGLYSLITITGSSSKFQSKIPLIVLILLLSIVIMTLAFIIRQFIASAKKQSQLQEPGVLLEKQNKEQQQFIRKQIEEAMKQGAHNSFARKLFIQKNKQLRKKKKPFVEDIDDIKVQQIILLKQQIIEKKKKKKNTLFYSAANGINASNRNDFNGENKQNFNQLGINAFESNQLNDNNENRWPQLTVERFHIVDQMLKQGFI